MRVLYGHIIMHWFGRYMVILMLKTLATDDAFFVSKSKTEV